MKLEIGAGNSNRVGFIHTDLNLIPDNHVEVVCKGEQLPFKNSIFTEVYMMGVYEHFTCAGAESLLQECNRVLIDGGIVDFTTPDLDAVCRIVVENTLPFIDSYHKRPPKDYALTCLYGGQDRPGQIHQWAWTRDSITKILNRFGFEVIHLADDAYEPHTHLHVLGRKVRNA